MKTLIIKKILRVLLILYPFYCLYVAIEPDNSCQNIFYMISFVLGMFIMIGGGIILMLLCVGLISMILQKSINWLFDRDIFD